MEVGRSWQHAEALVAKVDKMFGHATHCALIFIADRRVNAFAIDSPHQYVGKLLPAYQGQQVGMMTRADERETVYPTFDECPHEMHFQIAIIAMTRQQSYVIELEKFTFQRIQSTRVEFVHEGRSDNTNSP